MDLIIKLFYILFIDYTSNYLLLLMKAILQYMNLIVLFKLIFSSIIISDINKEKSKLRTYHKFLLITE